MANDGTLNQREKGTGLADDLIFNNSTPVFGTEEEAAQQGTMTDAQLEQLIRLERETANENNPNFYAEEKERLEAEEARETKKEADSPTMSQSEAEAKAEGVYGGIHATGGDSYYFGFGAENNQLAMDAESSEQLTEIEPYAEQEGSSEGHFGFGSESSQQAMDEAENIEPSELQPETEQEAGDCGYFGFGSEENQQAMDEAEQQGIEQAIEPAVEQQTEQELEAE